MFSVYLKRKTGTGPVSISVDGTTFSTCVINGTIWTRCVINTLLTAATYNATIKIATSGDEVYAWGAQVELLTTQDNANVKYASTYIPTTTAPATRVLEFITFPGTNIDNTVGTAYMELVNPQYSYPYFLNCGNSIIYGFPTYVAAWDGTNTSSSPGVIFINGKAITKWSKNCTKKVALNGSIGASGPYVGNWGGTYVSIGTAGFYPFTTIKNVKIWKKALTDAKMISLTTL
jgi:hypothetical protein